VATVSSGLASKPAATVFSNLALKLVAIVSFGLASKPMVGFLVELQNQGGGGFSGLGPHNRQLWFGDLGLKITASVSWLSLKTKVVEGFPVWASKPAALVW
jgi:hypothetical protein